MAATVAPALERPRFREHEAALVAELLRMSRLTVLVGERGAGKTTLLKRGTLPLLGRRVDDRFAGRRVEHLVIPFPDRRASSERPGEIAIYFDGWNEAPLAELEARIASALIVRRLRVTPPFPPLAQSLGAWSAELGVRFLFIFDHFEAVAAARAPTPALLAFEDALVAIVNDPQAAANCLVAVRDDAADALDRFRARIPDFGDASVRVLPYERGTGPRDAAAADRAAIDVGPQTAAAAGLADARPSEDGLPAMQPASTWDDDRADAPASLATLAALREWDEASLRRRATTEEALEVLRAWRPEQVGEKSPPSGNEAAVVESEAAPSGRDLPPPASLADAQREQTPGAKPEPALGPAAGPSPSAAAPQPPGTSRSRIAWLPTVRRRSSRRGILIGLVALALVLASTRLMEPSSPAPVAREDAAAAMERAQAPERPLAATNVQRASPQTSPGEAAGPPAGSPIADAVGDPGMMPRGEAAAHPDAMASALGRAVPSPVSAPATARNAGAPAALPMKPRLVVSVDADNETNAVIMSELSRVVGDDGPFSLVHARQASALAVSAPIAITSFDALRPPPGARRPAGSGADSFAILTPLYTEEVHAIVRRNSPIRFLHEIRGLRINVGAAGTGSRLTALRLYSRLFETPLPAASMSELPPREALASLVDDRTIDVVVIVEAQPVRWLAELPPGTASSIRLLQIDGDHPTAARAIEDYAPARIRAAGYRWLEDDVASLASMAFMVVDRGRADADRDAITALAATLCDRLPDLWAAGHPKWREVQPGVRLEGGWRVWPPARSAFDACRARARAGAAAAPSTLSVRDRW